MDTYVMENGEAGQGVPSKNIIEIFGDFMARIVKFEELVTMGNRLLVGFQQALGFIGRPLIEKSALLEHIMKAHGTKRLLSYVEAGCVNSRDSVNNVSQLHACHLGLEDNINKANIVLTELKCLLDDLGAIVQLAKEQREDEDLSSPSEHSKPKVVDYAATMAIIYSMVKQDYNMQDKIVSSLSLKSSQGELQTYCQMWSLRPYIDDDIMHQAWSLVP